MNRPLVRTAGTLALAALVLVVVSGTFARVRHFEFLDYDDPVHVVNNPHLRPPVRDNLGELWRRPYRGVYIPVAYTFFAAEAWLAGPSGAGETVALDPSVFHTGALVAHTLAVLGVFLLLRELIEHDWAAAGAILFGLHPLQVESVAHVTGTPGVLCGAFSMFALWQYVQYAKGGLDLSSDAKRRSSRRWIIGTHYVLATLLFVLAILSKPLAVALPLVAFILDWLWLRRPLLRAVLAVAPWLLIAVGLAILTKGAQPDQEIAYRSSAWARPLIAADALTFYLVKLVVPLKLGPDYGRSPAWLMESSALYWTWTVPVAMVTLAAWLRAGRWWWVSIAIVVAALLPVLGLIPFAYQDFSTVADRYAYLAMLGPALAIGYRMARAPRLWAIGGATLGTAALAIACAMQTAHWRNTDTFVARALAVNPTSYLLLDIAGDALERRGAWDEAFEYYLRARDLHPEIARTQLNLGLALCRRGRLNEALVSLEQARQLAPELAIIDDQMGMALVGLGKPEEAVGYFQEALRKQPNFELARKNLADTFRSLGRLDDAIGIYRELVARYAKNAAMMSALGSALLARGEAAEAERLCREAVRLAPREPVAHHNLAAVLEQTGRPDEAIAEYRAALALDPQFAEAHNNLGVLFLSQGRPDDARRHLAQALRIRPDFVQARRNLEAITGTRP